jgi:hypothetical protein
MKIPVGSIPLHSCSEVQYHFFECDAMAALTSLQYNGSFEISFGCAVRFLCSWFFIHPV